MHSKGINISTRYIKNFSPKIHLPVTYISNVLPPNRNEIEPEFAKYETDYKTGVISLIYCAAEPDLKFLVAMFIFTIVDFFNTFEQEFSTVVDHRKKHCLIAQIIADF